MGTFGTKNKKVLAFNEWVFHTYDSYFSEEDCDLIRYKYSHRKGSAKVKKISFLLSIEQYTQKIYEAKIKPNQIGRGINDYHLARCAIIYGEKIIDGDLPYSSNTCEFILHSENIGKRDKSSYKTKEFKEKQRVARLGKKHSKETKVKMSKAKKLKNNLGTIWIHNPYTKERRMIPKDSEVPGGFIKGKNRIE